MFPLVFWILFWEPWWSRFVGIRGAPRLTEACPRHAWQELLWKKPPLRTSTCGRHRFRRNHPLWGPRMWQGQVWEARPDGESTRGKAKFGKRHGSASGKKRTPQHEGVTEGRGRNGRKSPPPIQCATYPIGHPQGGLLSITLCFSNAGNASAAIFCWLLASAVVLRKASPASAGASAGIRACVGRYVNQNGCFSGPCLATLLPRLIEIARACNHSSWFKFSSSQYPLENYKLRNMVFFRAILCLGVPSSVNVCNFIDDLGVSASIEISWLHYHVKTRARRSSSFSQLGLEPNHTGWTAQSLFFLEESCRIKRCDTETFSDYSK